MSSATLNGQLTPRDYAAEYYAAGLAVIPIRADGTKAPAMPAGDYLSRFPTEAEVARRFLADNVGIGIPHGTISGNTECIDIDNQDLFGPYCAEVNRIQPGLIGRLTCIQTPRPGYHFVYKCETVEGSHKLALTKPLPQFKDDGTPLLDEKTGQQKLAPVTLIETKGIGGYTLAPGSPGECHKTGRCYEQFSGPPLTKLPTITTAERDDLLLVARSLNELIDEPTDESPRYGSSGSTHQGLKPGEDYAQRVSWSDVLTSHGWVIDHSNGERLYWRRPGKEVGWSATSGFRCANGTDPLCVYSTSAYPFEGANGSKSCTTYNKFAAYAKLNHGNDFSAAAKQLALDGYGERIIKGGEEFGPVPQGEQEQERKPRDPVEKFTLSKLVTDYPLMAPPVVDGLVREGETANLISVSKIGKSWLAYLLALCILLGRPWLGRFKTAKGRVLLIDNELHRATLACRIPKVAAAYGEQMGEFLSVDEYGGEFDIWPLRGRLRSLQELRSEFDQIEPGYYKAIIFDAKYRFALAGVSENDNAAETLVYNLLDQYAEKLQAALILVHHSSKGGQSDKRVTDVGSGAGAQSRAADCHMVLREHEDPELVVLDAAVRSFPPVEPLALRWQFPLWVADGNADATKLRGKKTRQEEQQEQKDHEAKAEIVQALRKDPLTASKIRKATGFSSGRVERLIAMLIKADQITATEITVFGNKCDEYSLAEDTE